MFSKWFAPNDSKRSVPAASGDVSPRVAPHTTNIARTDGDGDAPVNDMPPRLYQPPSAVVHYTPSMSDTTDYDSDEYIPNEIPVHEEESASMHSYAADRRSDGHHKGPLTTSDPDSHYLTNAPTSSARYSAPTRLPKRSLTAQRDPSQRPVVYMGCIKPVDHEDHFEEEDYSLHTKPTRARGGAPTTVTVKKEKKFKQPSISEAPEEKEEAPVPEKQKKTKKKTGATTSDKEPVAPTIKRKLERDYESTKESKRKVRTPQPPATNTVLLPALTVEQHEYYLNRAREFIARYERQTQQVQNSPACRFLLAVQGYANLPIESLVSNWKAVVEQPQRIAGTLNLLSVARALYHMEYDVKRRIAPAALVAESADDNHDMSSTSTAPTLPRMPSAEILSYLRPKGKADPSTRTQFGRRRVSMQLSDSEDDGSDDDDDDNFEIDERPREEEEQQQQTVKREEHQDGLVPLDLYRELREVVPELRTFATEPYVQRVVPNLVVPRPVTDAAGDDVPPPPLPIVPAAPIPQPPTGLTMHAVVNDLLTGGLNTTGVFRAAAQQAELRAGQFNPELQSARIDDYLSDSNAMSLMAQLVAYHITRCSTLTPRRDTKMVQLPAINAAIQSVLGQMMYLKWGWGQQAQRRVLQFDYSRWHSILQDRQSSIAASMGSSGCGSLFDNGGARHISVPYGSVTAGFNTFYDGYRTYV